MKCKRCGKEINLHVFGMPEDLCYGCATEKEKNNVAEINISVVKNIVKEKDE